MPATKPKTLKSRSHWVVVVAALIRRQGKVLVGQRPEGGSLARTWEFPGGKLELDESPESALARELKEELGIEAEIGSLKFAATHTYGKTGLLFLFFEVKYWKGQIKTQQHIELKWVQPKELRELELPEANTRFLDKIMDVL
ncbi:MAG: (deoxy)nucleoside triphosphate pyrophosphohydrolase [Bdellovibrionales bacterium]